MKTNLKLASLLALALAVPAAALVACSSDDAPVGPNNTVDSGAADTGSQPDTGAQPDGGADGSPNACATGITFDNTRVPGFPNSIPQP